MKISRNDPCPCGSGKKYKKCCIDKSKRNASSVNTVPIENSESDYDYIVDTAKKLEQTISLYSIDDVAKAIFCINSWANNRSALAQSLTLNKSVSNIKVFGNQSIKEYSELKDFFDDIISYLQITYREDLTLNDFGEVKIIIEGETFPVILGTGHEMVYSVMRFLPALAKVIDKTDELKEILYYNSITIDALSGYNISYTNKDYEAVFELPSEEFWQAVNRLLDSNEFSENATKAFQIMGYQKCPIEMQHFFVYREAWYPLYNTSILVDLYKKLLSLATEEENTRHVKLTIGQLIENMYNFSNYDHSRVLIAPVVINKTTGKPYTNNRLAFMTIDSKRRVLIALYKADFENDDSINTEIHLIDSLHKRNDLRLGETYYREELHGGYAFDILDDMALQIILIEFSTDISAHGVILGNLIERFTCSALDLIYLLCFIEDFNELLDFIEYESKEEAQIIAFGGKSNLFFTWRNSHRYIASGAIEYNMMSLSYGTADDFVFDFYTKNLSSYPFGLKSKLFAEPFYWKVKQGDFGYSHLERKGCKGFGGEGKMISASTFLFLAHNVDFFEFDDLNQDNQTAIRTINELNQRIFNRYGELLGQLPFLNGKVFQVIFMPIHYARKVDQSGFTEDENKKYVYSDIFVDSETVIIRYTVNSDELLWAIMKAKDKSIESTYFLELIAPLRKYINISYDELEVIVKADSSLKKEIGVFAIEQDYYYSDRAPRNQMEACNFKKARKEIAKVCLVAGAEPGDYRGKAATKVIRKMQAAIVSVFEEQISQYNKIELHQYALNYYATLLHEIIINLKRYTSFTDLDPAVQNEFEEKTRNIREEHRRNLRTAQYLLESNLACQHQEYTSDCRNDEFVNLLAFADWLVVLQDNADTCYFTDFDLSINIDSEYKVDTILSEFSEQQYEQILLRKYNQVDYKIKNDVTDQTYFIQSANAFLEDTGVELGTLISLIEYFQLKAVQKPFVVEVYPNVFEAPKDKIIKDYLELLVECKAGDLEKVEKALNFITLDCGKLKLLNGEKHDILPIWDREKRDNRFDVKPIIILEGKCVFSPVVMKQLSTSWKSGFFEWYLPFEIGLEKVKNELAKWKKRYEDMMVQDLTRVFLDAGYDPVFPEIELVSRYPQNDFPEELGDYDIIAVAQSKKEIWLIESKVLQKVGSIYEDQMQQKSFFYQHKDDEKFQRRIDYIRENLSKVTGVLGLDEMEYSVVPFMVTNKLFTSRYKQIAFPIATYDEVTQILKKD